MADVDWTTEAQPSVLLSAANGRVSSRKLRLVACAGCRRWWRELDKPARHLIEAAETLADGGPADQRLLTAYHMEAMPGVLSGSARFRFFAGEAVMQLGWPPGPTEPEHLKAAVVLAHLVGAVGLRYERTADGYARARASESAAQAGLVRCIIPNPARPVAFDPDWRTETAVALARRMYDARDFSLLPILADALDDAGCDQPDLLAHCRTPGPHARGCRAVDAVLGLS